MFKNFLVSITRNGLSLAGTGLAIASAVLIISLFFMEQLGFEGGPYLGILTYLILPVLFVLGLALIPAGAVLYRHKLRRVHGDAQAPVLPVFDLNVPRTRRWLFILLGATMFNIVVLAGATYKGVEVMESVEFCGMACHTVMEPEHTAYQRSAHSRVACAECHIGPGRGLVRQIQARWRLAAGCGGARSLSSADPDAASRPAPCAGNLRAVPLADEIRRRQAEYQEAFRGR